MAVLTSMARPRRLLVVALVVASLLAGALKIAGALLDVPWLAWAQWCYIPPLALALVLAGALRDRRGCWWLGGLLLSWLGDVLGGFHFLVLLGSFLLAHVCYLIALWPTRHRSLLGRSGSIPYLVLGAVGIAVLAPAAWPTLTLPVVGYAAALTLMALLASAAGRLGVVGGLLFMVSDLVLGLGIFAVDLTPAWQTTLVIGTYVPAQALLLLGVLGLIDRSVNAAASRRSTV